MTVDRHASLLSRLMDAAILDSVYRGQGKILHYFINFLS